MDGNWKTLPLVNFGKKNYNNDAGNNVGEPQREGVGKCVDGKLRKDADLLEFRRLFNNIQDKDSIFACLLVLQESAYNVERLSSDFQEET